MRLAIALMAIATGSLSLLSGCEQAADQAFPAVDRLTAGIFLDLEATRAVLPDGTALRAVNDKGIALTKTSEGFRSQLYNDAAGYCTIGFGHLVKRASCDGTEPAGFLDGISEGEGTEILIDDMATAQITVMTAVDVALTDGQFAALCDFVFNVGSGNFRKSTLLKVVNAAEWNGVPFQLRRWVKAGGRELPGLVKRREKEIELFFDGVPIPRTAPPADDAWQPVDIRTGEQS